MRRHRRSRSYRFALAVKVFLHLERSGGRHSTSKRGPTLVLRRRIDMSVPTRILHERNVDTIGGARRRPCLGGWYPRRRHPQ
jgi:hypothetical protein